MPAFTVQKSILIHVPLEKVHTVVRNFRQWPTWSPWLIAEPDCTIDYAEDGNSYSWEGPIVGSGAMAIVNEDPPHSIDYQLRFVKPWKSLSKVRFSFQEKNNGVEATWTMEGSLPFFLFWMKRMMTTFIGMDYERGLNMLKDFVETGSVPSKLAFPGPQSFPGLHYVGIRNHCPLSAIGDTMEQDFKKLESWFCESGTQATSNPLSIYHQWDLKKGVTEYTLAFPIAAPPSSLPTGFLSGELPACEAYPVHHTGPYRHLGNAWAAGVMHGRAKIFRQSKKIHPFEVYENSPQDTPEDELLTAIHFPLQ